jgi:hypothetical protein
VAISLPYLASPGSIKACLDKIKNAATPDRVTQDFIMTKLQIKGGTGAALIPYMKKIGFVASDGSPTDLYRQFRNHSTAGAAAEKAIKTGYKELVQANEYFIDLSDKDLLALIVQVTGVEAGNQVAKLTLSTLKALKAFSNFNKDVGSVKDSKVEGESSNNLSDKKPPHTNGDGRRQGLNLSYTINLNLPATTDQAVFNAIFRGLKEHLISDNE